MTLFARLSATTAEGRADERGVALLSLVFLLLPLAMVLGSFLTSMHGRTRRLDRAIADERSFQAAEAGVDQAIFAARTGALVSGTVIRRTLPDGSSFVATPRYLGNDGIDNDGDGLIDAADTEEDVFQVSVQGTNLNTRRTVVTYLGRTSFLPSIDAAFTTHRSTMGIALSGTPRIDGNNYNVNGTLAAANPNSRGIKIAAPGTTANLLSQLTVTERAMVLGPAGPPSLGTTTAMDLNAIVAEARNAANIVLTNSSYSTYQFGNASAGTANVVFREGNVTFQGNSRGAGLLVVTGNLTIRGTFRFDGVVIVLGNMDNSAGTADIYGGVVMGPNATMLDLRGTSRVRYSSQAIAIAQNLANRYVAFNGWQELSRN